MTGTYESVVVVYASTTLRVAAADHQLILTAARETRAREHSHGPHYGGASSPSSEAILAPWLRYRRPRYILVARRPACSAPTYTLAARKRVDPTDPIRSDTIRYDTIPVRRVSLSRASAECGEAARARPPRLARTSVPWPLRPQVDRERARYRGIAQSGLCARGIRSAYGARKRERPVARSIGDRDFRDLSNFLSAALSHPGLRAGARTEEQNELRKLAKRYAHDCARQFWLWFRYSCS